MRNVCVLVAGLVVGLSLLWALGGEGGGRWYYNTKWVMNTIWYWYWVLPWSKAVVVTPMNCFCVDQVSAYSFYCIEALLSEDLKCWIQASPARFFVGSKDLECTPQGAPHHLRAAHPKRGITECICSYREFGMGVVPCCHDVGFIARHCVRQLDTKTSYLVGDLAGERAQKKEKRYG